MSLFSFKFDVISFLCLDKLYVIHSIVILFKEKNNKKAQLYSLSICMNGSELHESYLFFNYVSLKQIIDRTHDTVIDDRLHH